MKEKVIATIGYCVPVQRFSFIFLVSIGLVHVHRTHKPFFLTKYSLKISSIILFTQLKIILL